MNEKHEKHIPQGKYVGHIEHFPNQTENVFTFIIDEAEDNTLIGKGISQKIHITGTKNERKK